jgi:hypothetical protein
MPISNPHFSVSCNPLALSIKYCKLQAGASRLSAFRMVWKCAGESLLHTSTSLSSAPSNFWMAFIVPMTIPLPSHTATWTPPSAFHCSSEFAQHVLMKCISSQTRDSPSCPKHHALLPIHFPWSFCQGDPSCVFYGSLVSTGLSVRGTHLACSMGVLYQLSGFTNSPSPSHALFPFSTQVWAYFYKLSVAPLVYCTLPNNLTLNSTHCFYISSILTMLAKVD